MLYYYVDLRLYFSTICLQSISISSDEKVLLLVIVQKLKSAVSPPGRGIKLVTFAKIFCKNNEGLGTIYFCTHFKPPILLQILHSSIFSTCTGNFFPHCLCCQNLVNNSSRHKKMPRLNHNTCFV